MFTGIIETVGKIITIEKAGSNLIFWVESPISQELTVDQSVSHNGVCLTVEEIKKNAHRVSAIAETLKKTNLENNRAADLLNLERCLRVNGRFDGHIVQGHVDTVGTCIEKKEYAGSIEFRFSFDEQYGHLIIEKGSICLNGISLTAFDVTKSEFSVGIIPYTYANTNMKALVVNDFVNLEFDVIGKYVDRLMQQRL
jgi:riboflavin synthase